MFEYLGALMGMALCTKFPLPLDLPSALWKQLLNIQVRMRENA